MTQAEAVSFFLKTFWLVVAVPFCFLGFVFFGHPSDKLHRFAIDLFAVAIGLWVSLLMFRFLPAPEAVAVLAFLTCATAGLAWAARRGWDEAMERFNAARSQSPDKSSPHLQRSELEAEG